MPVAAVTPDWGVVTNAAGSAILFDLDSDNIVVNNYGADSAGNVQFAASLDDANSGLTHGGQIIWYSLTNGGQTLTGETRVGNVMTGAPQQQVFEINLQPGADDNHYSVQMFATVDSFVDLVFSGLTYDFVGGNDAWAGYVPKGQIDGKVKDIPLNDDSKDLLLTPIGTATAVNGNANSAGATGPIAGLAIGQGEGMRLDFVEDLTGIPTPGDYGIPGNQTHDFDAHYLVNGATLRFGSGTSSATKTSFKAYGFSTLVIDDDGDDNNADLVAGTGTHVSVTSVAITFDGERELVAFDAGDLSPRTVTVGSVNAVADRQYTVQFVKDADTGAWHAEVTGVHDNQVTISTFGATNYSALEIVHMGPSTSDAAYVITGFSTAVVSTDPVFTSLPIETVDADGDALSSSLSLAFGGTPISGTDATDTGLGTDADDLIYGGLGADALDGGAGNDALIGGAGADTLTGGSGRDIFVVAPADLTGTSDDTVSDYSVAEGDMISLVALFDSLGIKAPVDAVSAASLVKLSGTKLYVDADGTGAGTAFAPVLNFGTAPTSVLVAYNAGSAPITVTASAVPEVVVPPVVIDLDGDGVEFSSFAAGVAFDYDGNGVAHSTAWAGAHDGLLAIDLNGDGIINDGSEIVFGGDGLTDLQGLAAKYDSNRDGVLDANDAHFAKFGVWQDANQNGVTDEGEFRSLGDAGIVSIKLVSDNQSYLAAGGDVLVHGMGEYTKADGTIGKLADASFLTVGEDIENRLNSTGMTSALVASAALAFASEPVLADAPDTSPALPSAEPVPAYSEPVAPVIEESAEPETSSALFADPAPSEQSGGEETSHSLSDDLQDAPQTLAEPVDQVSTSDEPQADQVNTAVETHGFEGFVSSDGHLMDALLLAASAGQPDQADAAQSTAALPTVQVAVEEALASSHAEAAIDALVNQLAGNTGAAPHGGEVGPVDASGLLASLLGQGNAGDHAMIAPQAFEFHQSMDANALLAA